MSDRVVALWALRHGFERRYQREKLAERAWLWLARHMPRRLRYWTFISAAAAATTRERFYRSEVPGIPLGDLLDEVAKVEGMS